MSGKFEVVLNAVREGCPNAQLAIHLRPYDSGDAAERQLAHE